MNNNTLLDFSLSHEGRRKVIHLTEMQRSMDAAAKYGQTVRLRCWKQSTGDIISYDDWAVIGSHWRGGTHRLKNPLNGQIRQVRDCTIFEYMGREVFW